MNRYKSIFLLLFFGVTLVSSAQDREIHWLTFEQLEDSLALAPKKVFINFYADWCAYCKKMDAAAYKDPSVIAIMNTAYYAVKMNAESTDEISFDGQLFKNKQLGINRNPVHEIPLLLASREGMSFSLPAMVVLDESFTVTDRYFEYLSPRRLEAILKDAE